jgi:DNA polymerase-3 subunit beta
MEIRINRDTFFKAISKVQSIIEKRSNMPILSMILLSTTNSNLNISATDLEISLQQTVPAEVIKKGSITISGRKIFEILKESTSDTIYFKEKENHWIFISDNKTQYNLACMPPEEYPIFIEPENTPTIEIPGEMLSEMINKTIYSVTMEEAGFKLSGVFIEKINKEDQTFLRMVATDGHRLSLIDKHDQNVKDMDIDKGVMIPKKGMLELNRLASGEDKISLGFKQNNCVAKKENSLIIIRLLETKFPDYNSVIPKKVKHKIKVNKQQILESMKKMMILSSESYRGVKITLEKNKMELVSVNPDLGDVKDNIEIQFDDKRLEMGFNSRYFIEVLQSMDSEEVEVAFIDNASPCIIKGDDDSGFLGLIMPMRI